MLSREPPHKDDVWAAGPVCLVLAYTALLFSTLPVVLPHCPALHAK